jgi:hypothetical protein
MPMPGKVTPHGAEKADTDITLDRLSDNYRLSFMSDGLNLAGIRRVLTLEAETRRLQAKIDQLRSR